MSFPDYVQQGVNLLQQGRLAEANELFDKAINIYSSDAQVWFFKGLTLYQMKQFKSANTCLDTTIRLNPKPRMSRQFSLKAMILAELGDYKSSLKFYDKALSIDKDPVVYFNKGNAFLNAGNPKKAIKCYESALKLNPNYKAARDNKRLIEKRLKEGTLTEGQDILKKQAKLDELFNKGNEFFERREFKEAITYYDQALEINPKDIRSLINKGLSHEKQFKLDEAIECYDLALKIKPDSVDALVNKGIAHDRGGKAELALECYDKALNIVPSSQEVRIKILVNKGVLYKNLKQYEEAMKYFDEALKLDSNMDALWFNKGGLYMELGNREEAEKCFARVKKSQFDFM